jgi:hypothetical protein
MDGWVSKWVDRLVDRMGFTKGEMGKLVYLWMVKGWLGVEWVNSGDWWVDGVSAGYSQ